jgi:hypothetical protein
MKATGMAVTIWAVLAAGAAAGQEVRLTASLPASGQASGARVVVRVYNYAGVNTEVLGKAEAEAGRIFGQAGVDVEWVEVDEILAAPSDGAAFNLKLLSETMAARLPRPAREFGFALHVDAFLFVHRVRDLARDSGFTLPLVLGHIMAHELGHLLLGENSHSPAGLMSETLRQREFELAARGGLLFGPVEARRMRSRLAAGSF